MAAWFHAGSVPDKGRQAARGMVRPRGNDRAPPLLCVEDRHRAALAAPLFPGGYEIADTLGVDAHRGAPAEPTGSPPRS
jgi:hypothetical protein